MTLFRNRFGAGKIIIGVCHLPPLPDYPESPGIEAICRHARDDMVAMKQAGLHGILLENEGDKPHKVKAGATTIDAMTAVSKSTIAHAAGFAVGAEILLNDPLASLEVAARSGAGFIRTDYFVDRMSRPVYGEFEIFPEKILQHRKTLGATDILILADIQVKYATMLQPRPLRESAVEAALRGADAVVVSGDATGDAPLIEHLQAARAGIQAAGCDIPVLIGSGLSPANAAMLLAECDGAIVGSSLMQAGKVDSRFAHDLMQAVRDERQ
ncbi:BtpA/SgcQ family protein [Woeseia oceani]|uniref:Phosphorybosylanthranilate isomerase n=1 Tax=Woeseia oceani TaxID=1548547 RepID=A0A193LEA9_9GAMM|nr:BtpA/SgcQ family protein [Woeseia oceani]ANO50724.1 hypothetical protein BA177_05450 [Woeseia oceani]